tara:strand:- start:4391 stop:4522 length:132 start_codon:yes stop_codon:yes gene_type:complete
MAKAPSIVNTEPKAQQSAVTLRNAANAPVVVKESKISNKKESK